MLTRMTDPPLSEAAGSELALQRRWAESRWPAPFLQSPYGGMVRVISPGVWNRGPGPDFRGAQILDVEGRARRGDVELHLEPRAWLQHGHADDPAYHGLLLHVVDWAGRPQHEHTPPDMRVPDATPLPPPDSESSASVERPPCADIVPRAGEDAVEARLFAIARRRFLRKMSELQALNVPAGPGSAGDRRAVIAAARALAQPHNSRLAEQCVWGALERCDAWSEVSFVIEANGWRPGRGALGSPGGLGLVLSTLVQRWSESPETPSAAFERLASLPLREAIGQLRIPRRLGPTRTIQLLADAVYPLSGAWLQWARLPGARYQRTDELRARLDSEPGGHGVHGVSFGWRHPHTQALLELEQTRCRQWACSICPLAALARPLRRRLRTG